MAIDDTAHLLAAFNAGPAKVRRALEALDPSALDRSAERGEWTPRQILLHLADSELVGAVRIRQLLAQTRPTFPLYEQAIWAANLGYEGAGEQDLRDAIDLFERLRLSSERLLRAAPAASWERVGMHPERGPMTLVDLVQLYVGHVDGHLAQLRRAAGALIAE